MKLYLVWLGGRTIVGEIESVPEGKVETAILNPAEFRITMVLTNNGPMEIPTMSAITPGNPQNSIAIIPDFILELNDKPMQELYMKLRAKLSGLDIPILQKVC